MIHQIPKRCWNLTGLRLRAGCSGISDPDPTTWNVTMGVTQPDPTNAASRVLLTWTITFSVPFFSNNGYSSRQHAIDRSW
jgi:hypothetical protein